MTSANKTKGLKAAADLVGGWLELMSGGLSVPFAIFAAFNQGRERVLLTILAFVALGYFSYSLLRQLFALREQLRPKIEFAAGKNIAGSRTEIIDFSAEHGSAFERHVGVFFRVFVRSLNPDPIRECSALLTEISRDADALWNSDRQPLTFAPGGRPDSHAKTIHRRGEFLDVVFLTMYEEVKIATPGLAWRFYPELSQIFSRHGDYHLTVVVIGQGIPDQTVRLKFSWGGDFEKSELVIDRHVSDAVG